MKIGQQESLWILRAQSGDLEAEDRLFRAVQDPLFRYIVSVLRDEPRALDVLQEVFLRIHRKLAWLRDPQLFAPWVYRIASNEVMRHLQKEKRWREYHRQEDAEPEAPSTNDVLDRDQLVAAIDALPPRSRIAVALFYLEELSLEEVATVLAIPIGTVKSRLAYGREALRRILGEGHAH